MVRFIQDSGPFTPILRYQNDSNFVNLPSAPVTSRSNAPRSDSGYATQPPHTPSSTVIGLGEGSKDLSDARRPWPQGYYTSGQAAPMLVNTHGEAASKTSIFQGYKKIYRCARADCDKQCRSHSELTKHNMKHEKPFKCTELGCARDTGFTSNNDLDRHKKSVHKIEIPGSSSYRCASLKCPKSNHIWPRLDNFKAHIKRLHPDENPETLALRSIIMVPRSRRGDEALLLGMDASKYSMPSSGDARLLTEASGWSSIRGVKRKNDEPHEGSREKRVQIAEGAEKPTDSSSSQDVSLLDEAYDMDLPEAPASCNPNELLTNQTWTTSLSPTLTRQNLPPTVTETDLTTSNVETQQEDPNVPGRLQRSAVADASHTNAETSVAPSTTLTESAEPNERLSDDTEDSMGTTEAMEAPATLAQAMANLISENRLTNPEHLVQQVAQFIQRSGLARNVVDNGSNAATPRPSNMVAELDSTRSLPRNRDSSGTFKCRDCGKFSNRACDMKKHEKRHSRPYGCTFTGCMKTLGSKVNSPLS
ncbi:hypothetical protein EJ06DRAFT_428055 [Trichodelitschia bisporula]|uniref:C2H2-type domain-containing protein n=1 Tax=Trichodelitschia bisporula TaxID=703511 RepID=A0A6G1HWJ7_9PEZI|nr:hypothetical protein EJ06DRAFT_428055 [Trichodelitschia bisporula]